MLKTCSQHEPVSYTHLDVYKRQAHRGTNHIERHNLTIRTHIKRLTRRTICFSRKAIMLYAVLKIYF